jgi:hypothetical protein
VEQKKKMEKMENTTAIGVKRLLRIHANVQRGTSALVQNADPVMQSTTNRTLGKTPGGERIA